MGATLTGTYLWLAWQVRRDGSASTPNLFMRSVPSMSDFSKTEAPVRMPSVVTSHVRGCQGSCEERGRSRTRKVPTRRREQRTVRTCEDDEAGGWNWREEYGDFDYILIRFKPATLFHTYGIC